MSVKTGINHNITEILGGHILILKLTYTYVVIKYLDVYRRL